MRAAVGRDRLLDLRAVVRSSLEEADPGSHTMARTMFDVVTIVLGGGRGTRLFPLTHHRSKPAVPIGGKYRLIDIALSNCLHAGLRRIYVLTQFNSASLNRHIAQTYRMDHFSTGFVEVLAAEQTPEGEQWFQGTADAVRQAARHFREVDADYYLILAGDHVYRMDFASLIESHIERQADITIAAQPVTPQDATQMGIFRFDQSGRVAGFEEKPSPERLAEMASSAPAGPPSTWLEPDKPFVASMGIYVFSRDVLYEVLSRDAAVDFGREIIPHALGTHAVHPYLYRGFWADVGTVQSFYDVNLMLTRRGAPFNFFHPGRPIYTRPRFLPAARIHGCAIDEALVAEGAYLDSAEIRQSVIGIRGSVHRGARVTRSIVLGADLYEEPTGDLPLGIGRNAILDRVIVDKNARIGDDSRLVNERGIQNADGDGYYIRGGIIIVPKGAVVKPGTVV
ncbi:MAG TPA: glucose-1-phosphate adenylyltransferase [Vicinamibacterales bacterium]|nr:glucose-1-phosphate adenylyltransferase [Vicinamibacterales bacterium]